MPDTAIVDKTYEACGITTRVDVLCVIRAGNAIGYSEEATDVALATLCERMF